MIEQGLPAVRSANTGISGVIDPYGRVLSQLPLNEKGFLDGDLPKPLQPTLYANTGDWPILLLLLILGIIAKYVTIRTSKLPDS